MELNTSLEDSKIQESVSITVVHKYTMYIKNNTHLTFLFWLSLNIFLIIFINRLFFIRQSLVVYGVFSHGFKLTFSRSSIRVWAKYQISGPELTTLNRFGFYFSFRFRLLGKCWRKTTTTTGSLQTPVTATSRFLKLWKYLLQRDQNCNTEYHVKMMRQSEFDMELSKRPSK